MHQPPQFGQNIGRNAPLPDTDPRFDGLIEVLERMTNTMSIIIREIAGLSITNITDEVNVFPVEIVGVDQMLVRVAPTALTQVGARYLIGVKVDYGSIIVLLPLEEKTFTQDDINNLTNYTFPFAVSDLEGVESFIVEAFLDASIASVRATILPSSVGVGLTSTMTIAIDTGAVGLAGFIITINVIDAAVAKLVGVAFPPEFALAQFDPDPVNGPTVRVSGVDLADAVKGDQVDVVLASVGIEGLAVGTTGFDVTVEQLDDDKGFPVRYTLTVDSFTVVSS